jgi:hypothetical protein
MVRGDGVAMARDGGLRGWALGGEDPWCAEAGSHGYAAAATHHQGRNGGISLFFLNNNGDRGSRWEE